MSKKEEIRELKIRNNDLRLKYNEIIGKLNASEGDNIELRKELESVKIAHDYVVQNDFRKKAEDYRSKMNSFIDKLNLCSEENHKLRKENEELVGKNKKLTRDLERLGFSYCAALSLGATATTFVDQNELIHLRNTRLTFQRDQMRQQLNEKDYIISQLEAALEAAKVI